MPGTLFVVATPIGNLEDITLRALRVLREADLIAAEDTRRTARLLAHHGIPTRTISFHHHNIRTRLPGLMARLEAGGRLALVTDAGTPGVSDPGVELVRACIERGVGVEPVPGASAPLTAAMASGFPLEPLTVVGFAPVKAKDRKAWWSEIASLEHTVVFFEAPHRVEQMLAEAVGALGDRPIMVARELTKVHQQLIRGSAAEIVGQLTEHRGEFTVVVGPALPTDGRTSDAAAEDIVAEFGHMAHVGGLGRRAIVSELARKHGRPSREVYSMIERAKKSGI